MAQQHRIGTVHTTVQRLPNGIRVVYHSTTIVEQTAEGIRLDSGGWRTSTTKTRMNQTANQYGLGFSVFQKQGDWYVRHNDRDLPFEDGMVI
jgi:uncharacterized protein YcnI